MTKEDMGDPGDSTRSRSDAPNPLMTLLTVVEDTPSAMPSTFTHLWASYGPTGNCQIENWGEFKDREQAFDYLVDQVSGERDSGSEYVATLVWTGHRKTFEDWEEEARRSVPVRRRA